MAVLGVWLPPNWVGTGTDIASQFEYGVSWERPDILPIWEAQVRVICSIPPGAVLTTHERRI